MTWPTSPRRAGRRFFPRPCGRQVVTRAAAALLLAAAFLLGGCTTPAPLATTCQTVAACLLGPGTEPLLVVLHSSPGLAASPEALAVLDQQARELAARSLQIRDGEGVAGVPANASEADLHAVMQGAPGELHLYFV